MWLEYWGYMLGIPKNEFEYMPIGNLYDLISIYQITHDLAVEIYDEDKYFPKGVN